MRPSDGKTRTSLKIPLFFLSVLLGLLTYTSSAVPQMAGAFIPGASMITPREYHTATLLNNGQVLLAGGNAPSRSDAFSTAELYDPENGSFAATGSMTVARTQHTATLLPDGRVLIAGGRPLWVGEVSGAEIYNPATRTFTPTGAMTAARYAHTATLLNNGRVLIVGGGHPSPPLYGLASAEIYDPLTGTFTATGDMTLGWYGPAAALLPDGNVLVSGAYVSVPWSIPGIYGELYDPLSGMFTSWSTMTRPHLGWYGHTASLLQNGKVLIAGGGDVDDMFALASAGIYHPDTGSFVATGNMTLPRYTHTTTVLLDNTVLITGGYGGCCTGQLASAEIYNPDNGTFTYIGDMNTGRWGHTATALNNGHVLIAGGSTRPSTASTELYVPRLPVPASFVADLRFDQTSLAAGSSFNVSVSGSNLSPQSFFDVRFSAPGSNSYLVVLNWQKGLDANHTVPVGTAPGMWTINGVRAHQIETDHTGIFKPVSAAITVSP